MLSANGSSVFLGGAGYHGDNKIVDAYTPVLRARAWLPNASILYEQGCDVGADDDSEAGFPDAVAAAKVADTVILILGNSDDIDGEGQDRESLELPGAQAELALAVANAASAPIIVVLVNGCPLAIRDLKDSPKVGVVQLNVLYYNMYFTQGRCHR